MRKSYQLYSGTNVARSLFSKAENGHPVVVSLKFIENSLLLKRTNICRDTKGDRHVDMADAAQPATFKLIGPDGKVVNRRTRDPQQSYGDLLSSLRAAACTLSYTDEDGDICPVTSSDDLKEAARAGVRRLTVKVWYLCTASPRLARRHAPIPLVIILST